MDCKQVREVLDVYVDGELSSSAAAATSLHVAACPACERASSALRQLRFAVRFEVAQVSLPANFHQRLSRVLDRAVTPQTTEREPSGHVALWWPRFVLGTVPALVILLLFVPKRGRIITANILERIAVHVDGPHMTQLTGKLICRDCTLAQAAGMNPACERHGHHGALLTSDGHIWNIVEDDRSERLIHDSSLLGKEFRVSGMLYRQADVIQVEGYLPLS